MHRITRLAAGAALALGCALAGCGSTSTASSGGTHAQPSTIVTPTRAMNGCPTHLIPVDGYPHPDVLVTGQNEAFNQPVALHMHQILEVRLHADIFWHVMTSAPHEILAPVGLAGWYDDAHKACVWEFAANASGTTTLSFSGGLDCPPTAPCPAIAAAQMYTVTVG
jgi:hypothetical protein